jgi:hypothetical protein
MLDVQGQNAVFSVSRVAAESIIRSQFWAAREFRRAINRTAVILTEIRHQFQQEQKCPEAIADAGFDNALTLVATNLTNQLNEFAGQVTTVLVAPLGNRSDWGNASKAAKIPAPETTVSPSSDPSAKDELFLKGTQMLELAEVCDNWRHAVSSILQNVSALAVVVSKPHHIPKLAAKERCAVTAGWQRDWEAADTQFIKNFWLPTAFGMVWPPETPRRWE